MDVWDDCIDSWHEVDQSCVALAQMTFRPLDNWDQRLDHDMRC
jgi:hypothetical protein